MSQSMEESFSGRVTLFFGVMIMIGVTIMSLAMVELAYVIFAISFFVFYWVVKIIWNSIGWLVKGSGYDASHGRNFGYLMWFCYVAGCIAFTLSAAGDMPVSP